MRQCCSIVDRLTLENGEGWNDGKTRPKPCGHLRCDKEPLTMSTEHAVERSTRRILKLFAELRSLPSFRGRYGRLVLNGFV